MDRGASAAVITETGKSRNRPIHLVSIETSSGTNYLTDAYKDQDFGGNTYNAVGYLLGFSEIEELSTLNISSITVSLSAVDQSYTALFLLDDYIDRPVKKYIAFLDDSQNIIADPVLIFSGHIDEAVITEDPGSGSAVISIGASNKFVNWEHSRYRTTNHENQQAEFPGDKGFEFSSEIIEEIFWGRLPNE